MAILLTWLGKTDIVNMQQDTDAAISSALLNSEKSFDRVVILANSWNDKWEQYESWMVKKLATSERPNQDIKIYEVDIVSPIDYESITKTISWWLEKLSNTNDTITINLSSGTPAMTAVSILLGKSLDNCNFILVSRDSEVLNANIPIDFSVVYKQSVNSNIISSLANTPKVEQAFSTITSKSDAIKSVLKKAHRLTQSELPVLILGETGTGKEVMAKAIHVGSERSNREFRAVNCGALPESLVDSILFGHVKGAFTGASADHKGLFSQADGGTLFLDEVGELPLDIQVKLLRVLQEKEITKVGGVKTESIDVRIISATHRNLFAMVEDNTFREDLFYRLAVGVLNLPPLRERYDDISQLVDELLTQINKESQKHPDIKSKNISHSAKLFISKYSWPGNIRELWNTLSRAALWCDTDLLDVDDIQSAILSTPKTTKVSGINLLLGDSFDLPQHIENTKKEYIESALLACGNSKTKAAKMLKVGSHQSLTNWMEKLGIE